MVMEGTHSMSSMRFSPVVLVVAVVTAIWPFSTGFAQPNPGAETSKAAPSVPSEGGEQGTGLAAPAPQIVFDATTHDFGRVMEGESARHDFTFSNPGDATLEITDIKTTCGCTKAGEWDKTVAPGGAGKIPIALRTKGTVGTLKKSIHVTSNVPAQKTITLYLKGTVWQPIEVKPRYASLGQVKDRNTPQSTTLKIISHLEEPLKILNVNSSEEAFRAEVKPIIAGKEYELVVTTVPPISVGSTRGTITLQTSSSKKPTVSITANCYLPVPVQVAPSRLVLLDAPLPQAMERTIYVTHNVAGPLKISDVEVDLENVEVRVAEKVPGKRYAIVMKFPAGFRLPEEGTASLRFKTDDPTAPSVEVPIVKSVAPGRKQAAARPSQSPGGAKPSAATAEQ